MLTKSDYLISLGDFIFSTSGTAFNKLRKKVQGGWSKSERAGNYPFFQATKAATTSFSLAGFYLPAMVGSKPMIKGNGEKELTQMVEDQEPVQMILGDGTIISWVIVLSAEFNKTLFLSDGTAQKVDFVLEIEGYYD